MYSLCARALRCTYKIGQSIRSDKELSRNANLTVRRIRVTLVDRKYQHSTRNNRQGDKMAENDVVWSFGYGSNMDVQSLQTKKHVQIVDHVCAVLRGWRMSFTLPGPPKVEPSYANVVHGDTTDEVHGVAFCMTRASGKELDRTESGYNKEAVSLHAYDGRVLEGFVYVNKPGALSPVEIPPSARYLGVLVKGAKAAGLNDVYVKNLAANEVHKPTEESLAWRRALPKPNQLEPMTVAQLAEHHAKSEQPYVAVFGYVIPARSYFGSHIGRDITTRMINQYHAIPMDDNDDAGKPPYPIKADLDPEVVEYVSTWMDHYLYKSDGKVVGYVKEFLEQQNSGKSDWKLPAAPKM